MAAYKLEDNIREKLEERKLKPSDNAWEKLELRLDTEQPKNKSYVWFYVAASIIGLVVLSTVFIDNNIISEDIQVVEVDSRENALEIQAPLTKNIEEVKTSEKIEKTEEESHKILKAKTSEQSTIEKKMEKTQVAANVKKEFESVSNPNIEEAILPEEFILNNKVEEVVAQIQNLKKNSQDVTMQEVELLLENANRDIQAKRIVNPSRVDALALLQDVELQLERSFRDKVFDALGDGYQIIRTAYLERNN